MNDAALKKLLSDIKTIAVVGLSSNPKRPSFGVSRFLQRQGYRVIPVNPNELGKEILGERVYASLKDIPQRIDLVDIFRRPDAVPPIVDEALEKGTGCIWMQEGVVNESAKNRAEAAGVLVVMDRCILKELARLFPI